MIDRNTLTLDQQWLVAYELAKTRLPEVNAALEDVVPADNAYARYVKRVLDVALSSVGCVVTLPINVVLGVITYFDVGRPLFFKQIRPP